MKEKIISKKICIKITTFLFFVIPLFTNADLLPLTLEPTEPSSSNESQDTGSIKFQNIDGSSSYTGDYMPNLDASLDDEKIKGLSDEIDKIHRDTELNKVNVDASSYAPTKNTQTSKTSSPGGLIECNGPECNIYDFIDLIHNVINYVLGLGIALVSITFAYAGYLYMTAQGDSSKVQQAHQMLKKTLFGFIIAISAFLLVQLLVKTLKVDMVVQLLNKNN